MKPNYTTLELFAGCGGLALGLSDAGLNAVGLVELDKDAGKTLSINKNWQVFNINIIDFNKNLGIYIDEAPDLISGGFPCQPFSYSGKCLGLNDTRGTLFFEFAEIISKLRPKLFLAENVKGLTTHDSGKTLKTIIKAFDEIGYNVNYSVLNANNYDVPQKRERLVIVGTRKDLPNTYKYPFPSQYKPVLRDALLNVPISDGTKYSVNKHKILNMIPAGGCWRDLPVDLAKEYLGNSYYLDGGKTGMARRISWDEPSLTLTCSPAQKQTERCHPDETRPFTVREYARIQTFPDSWEFYGGITSQYRQIGNAVPVNLAKKLGYSFIEYLNNPFENKCDQKIQPELI